MIIGVVLAASPVRVQSASATPMQFGMDIDSLDHAGRKGLGLSYGTFWVGSWTEKHGWASVESNLRLTRKSGVTPVINWWYWGDDISPRCIEQGCYDRRQRVQKNQATWSRMSERLSQVIEKTMGSREAIVVLETEFNKGGTERYDAFDGLLAEHVALFHRRGNVKVVLGFGNWGREHWGRFDRAINASDYIGTQLLRSSVRDRASYMSAVDTLVASAEYVQNTFGKPLLVTDLALSSYPAATYEVRQAHVIREVFDRLPELKRAGVRGLLYRMMADDPTFDTSNYHGVAERHWGLIRADGAEKPAFAPFAQGIRHESGIGSLTTVAGGKQR